MNLAEISTLCYDFFATNFMTNKEIAKHLRNIAASYTIKNDQKYRFQIIAYQRAAEALENTSTEASHLLEEGKLNQVPGIGSSIASHIEELIKNGDVKRWKWVTKGIPKGVFPLLDIPSFGPKKAYKLSLEFKLNDENTVIDKLEQIAKADKIKDLEGFGEKSQKDILQAIAEFKLGKNKASRMTLPFAYEIAERIVEYLKKSPLIIYSVPLGSLRRMVATVGDIDIAVSTKNPKGAIDYFIAYPYKERIIEKGPTTASISVSGGKQVDLMTQPPECFGSLLQHFTGSKNHNIHLRELALKKGLSLSEHGIKRKSLAKPDLAPREQMENYSSEEDFYKAIGLDWIPPEIRENEGEIELSLSNKLPRLVELSEIKGDLHIHSDFPIEPSHDLGRNSMKEMIKKAIELNYEYVGFSEHSPSVSKHTPESIYSILSRRKEVIEHLSLSTKNIRVINLLEVDILANGSFAINEKSIELEDALIVAIHSSFGMNKKDMTRRVLQGLSHPKAKILAHPTGRKLNERGEIRLDWNLIFDFVKNHNKALEINAWPNRLDLPDKLVREAVKHNIKMIINTDSHAVGQMDLMKFGVSVARRGWAQKSDILNTLKYNEFIKWLTT